VILTIYDVLRQVVENTPFGGKSDLEQKARKRAALRVIARLEELGLWGQIAIDTEEESKL